MLVKQSIPGLYGGVSTQNAALRSSTQCDIQENFTADLIDGLQLRAGSILLKKIIMEEQIPVNSRMEIVKRDETEKYLYIFTGLQTNPLLIYDLNTLEKYNVNFVDTALTYLTTDNPTRDIKMLSLADTSIVLNKTKTVKMQEILTQKKTGCCYFVITAGYDLTTYTISISGLGKATFFTGSSDPKAWRLPYIAKQFTISFQNATANSSAFKVFSFPDKNYFAVWSEAEFDLLQVSEDKTGYGIQAYNNRVKSIANLPVEGVPDRYSIMEIGDTSADFYVTYDGSRWAETTAPDLEFILDGATLPFFIKPARHGSFSVAEIGYDLRLVGDDRTNPLPSFVGKTIEDIFFHKNRLGFLSGQNVILSRAGDYFNFFSSSATDVLDNDPIDYAVLSTKVVKLEEAVSTSAGLFIKGGFKQFVLHSGEQALSPKTAVIEEVTDYLLNDCNVIQNESSLYLTGIQGNVWEYGISGDSLNAGGVEITSHIGGYLPKSLLKGVASGDKILFLDSADRRVIYLNQFAYNGEKVQNSWSKWIFDLEIVDLGVLDNILYLLQVTPLNETLLFTVDLNKTKETELNYAIHLDNQMYLVDGVYDPVKDLTKYELPILFEKLDNYLVVDIAKMNTLDFKATSNKDILCQGNTVGKSLVLGRIFKGHYRFSKVYVKDEKTGVGDIEAKLQLKRLLLAYKDTYSFKVVVTPTNRPSNTQLHTNRIFGLSPPDKTTLTSGEKAFLIFGDKETTIDLIVEGFTPGKFISATIEGLYVSKARSL